VRIPIFVQKCHERERRGRKGAFFEKKTCCSDESCSREDAVEQCKVTIGRFEASVAMLCWGESNPGKRRLSLCQLGEKSGRKKEQGFLFNSLVERNGLLLFSEAEGGVR